MNAIRRRLLGQPRLADIADSVETIESQSTESKPAAIFFATELEKAKAIPRETSWEAQLQRISESAVTHKPLLRYEFSDILVFHHGCGARGMSFHKYGRIPFGSLISEPIVPLDRAHYSMPPIAVPYFGHWISDAVPTALLTRNDEDLVMPVPDIWPHAREYAALFELNSRTSPLHHVTRLVVHDDVGQGQSRTRRYQELRRRIRSKFAAGGAAARNERIYLRRGTTGVPRIISNEDELVRRLKDHGFAVVDVATASVTDIMKAALDAAICVTVEGSQQDHAMIFLGNNGALVNIQPSTRFNCIAIDRAHPLGIHYGFVVAEAANGGFKVDCDSLLATLDLIEQRRCASPY